MTNVVITSDTTHIDAAFNGLHGEGDIEIVRSSTIDSLKLLGVGSRKGSYVEVDFTGGHRWTFDMNGTRGLVVDLVAGGVPTDNEDLLHKLAALIKL